VPILGDIPLLGALFRRETDQNEKIDLLIFLTASIVPAEGSPLVSTNLTGQAGISVQTSEPPPAGVVIAPPEPVAAPVSVVVVAEPELPAAPPVTVAPVAAPVEASAVPGPDRAAGSEASAPGAMEAPAVSVVSEPQAVTLPAAATSPGAEVPVVSAPAAASAPELVPGVAGTGAGDDLSRAIESAQAASTVAADRAREIRREFGIGAESTLPVAKP
jgi:general secretion pathway protein D